jgi:hypothetical protein
MTMDGGPTDAPLPTAVSKDFTIEIASGSTVEGDKTAATLTVILLLNTCNLQFFWHTCVGASCKCCVGFVRNSDWRAWRHLTIQADIKLTLPLSERRVAEKVTICRAPSAKPDDNCSLQTLLDFSCSSPPYPQRRLLPYGYCRVVHFLESIDLRIPCCYAPPFSSTPCCQQMLSFAGATLGCPFTTRGSTSEGEQCLFSHISGADVAFDTNARLPDGELSAFNRPRKCGSECRQAHARRCWPEMRMRVRSSKGGRVQW